MRDSSMRDSIDARLHCGAKLVLSDHSKFAGEGARATLTSRAYDGSHIDSLLVLHSLLTYSRFQMQNRTETLGIGSRAPDFSLTAANRQGNFSLSTLRAQGLAVLEFLRGTW